MRRLSWISRSKELSVMLIMLKLSKDPFINMSSMFHMLHIADGLGEASLETHKIQVLITTNPKISRCFTAISCSTATKRIFMDDIITQQGRKVILVLE